MTPVGSRARSSSLPSAWCSSAASRLRTPNPLCGYVSTHNRANRVSGSPCHVSDRRPKYSLYRLQIAKDGGPFGCGYLCTLFASAPPTGHSRVLPDDYKQP
jgi:hypothetical protein